MPKSRPMIASVLGTYVRKLREKKGLSQTGLADLSGLHRSYVGDIERAKRNISLLNCERIAEALEVSTSQLIKGAERMRDSM